MWGIVVIHFVVFFGKKVMKIPKESNETVDEPERAHAGDENFVVKTKGMLTEPAHDIKERERNIYLQQSNENRSTTWRIAESGAPRRAVRACQTGQNFVFGNCVLSYCVIFSVFYRVFTRLEIHENICARNFFEV